LINKHPQSYWVLSTDIDFAAAKEDGSAFVVASFSGGFDGNFHTISNFKIDCVKNACGNLPYTALFGQATKAIFKKLYLTGFQIIQNSKTNAIAGLVGNSTQSQFSQIAVDGKIESSGLDVNLTGTWGIGALVGQDYASTFQEISANLVSVGNSTPYSIGALGGRVCNSTIANSIGSADLKNVWMSGGLIGGCGSGDSTIEISNSIFSGSFDYDSSNPKNQGWGPCVYANGITPHANTKNISNSFWLGGSGFCKGVENIKYKI